MFLNHLSQEQLNYPEVQSRKDQGAIQSTSETINIEKSQRRSANLTTIKGRTSKNIPIFESLALSELPPKEVNMSSYSEDEQTKIKIVARKEEEEPGTDLFDTYYKSLVGPNASVSNVPKHGVAVRKASRPNDRRQLAVGKSRESSYYMPQRNLKRFNQFDDEGAISLFDVQQKTKEGRKETSNRERIQPGIETSNRERIQPGIPSVRLPLLNLQEVFQVTRRATTLVTPSARDGKSR